MALATFRRAQTLAVASPLKIWGQILVEDALAWGHLSAGYCWLAAVSRGGDAGVCQGKKEPRGEGVGTKDLRAGEYICYVRVVHTAYNSWRYKVDQNKKLVQ